MHYYNRWRCRRSVHLAKILSGVLLTLSCFKLDSRSLKWFIWNCKSSLTSYSRCVYLHSEVLGLFHMWLPETSFFKVGAFQICAFSCSAVPDEILTVWQSFCYCLWVTKGRSRARWSAFVVSAVHVVLDTHLSVHSQCLIWFRCVCVSQHSQCLGFAPGGAQRPGSARAQTWAIACKTFAHSLWTVSPTPFGFDNGVTFIFPFPVFSLLIYPWFWSWGIR